MVKERGLGEVDKSRLERFLRNFSQGILCLFFGHETLGIITTHGETQTRHEECLLCGKIVKGEEVVPYVREAYATEILVHQTEHCDTMGVSFVGGKEVFTHIVYCDPECENQDPLESACDLANNFEEATGIPWRLHDESKGQFKALYE